MTNWEVFLETLPIIGTSLVGIFGVTAVIILIVILLNKGANYLEDMKDKKDNSENN